MKPLVLVIIATGDQTYVNFACDLLKMARRYFPQHESVVFTDSKLPPGYATHEIYTEHDGWVNSTISRYRLMLENETLLADYDNILFMDADLLPVSRVIMEEFKTNGILAVQHPSYPQAWERDPRSTAYVEGDHQPYFQGCLQGGATDPFLVMCTVLNERISIDDSNGVLATNHDESHLNRYLLDHPPTKVLGPEFAFPGPLVGRADHLYPFLEGKSPRIRHRDKNMAREGR